MAGALLFLLGACVGCWRGDIDRAPPPHLVAAGLVPMPPAHLVQGMTLIHPSGAATAAPPAPAQVHYSTLTPPPTGVAAVAVPQQVHVLRPAVKPPPPMLHAVYMTNQQANRGCHPVGCGHVHAHFVNKI